MFKPKTVGPVPWVIFGLPNIFKDNVKNITKMADLPPDVYIALELMVLLAQPQPNWALLLKVVCLPSTGFCHCFNLFCRFFV